MLELQQNKTFNFPSNTEVNSEPTLAELMHDEPWSWVESNEPYTPKNNPEATQARAKAKEDFINNPDLEEPDIDFPDIDIDEIQDAILRYDKILFSMHITDKDGPEGKFLYEHAARKIAELTRLKVVYEAQAAHDPIEKQRLRQYAVELSTALFGKPDKAILEAMVCSLRQKANTEQSPYAIGLMSLLPHVEGDRTYEPVVMKQETVNILRGDLLELFAPIFATIDQDGDPGDTDEALVKLQRMIDAMGLKGAIAKKTLKRALEVGGKDLALYLGAQRAVPTNQVLGTTGIHEFIHLLGYYRASQEDPNTIYGLGMPGTLNTEEGKAVGVEQILKGVAAPRGENFYLATGLLLGSIDGRARTPRETYEIMWRRLLVQQNKEDDESVKKAKSTAYDTVMRSNRGLACDTRDISYYDGNALMAPIFDAIAQLPAVERKKALWDTLTTRADYANAQQVEYVQQHERARIAELDARLENDS